LKPFEQTISSITEIPALSEAILQHSEGKKIFAFHGEMGSGKTTIIKGICSLLGSHDNFSSPSYSIVNEYLAEATNEKIYHIDLYRLKDLDEALAIGIEDYITGKNYCFIEWPELIVPLLPANVVNVSIIHDGDMRKISIFNG
jgi:tRNA threonylcarbamoyladenosine biosynthesis protein TsaE